MAGQGGPAQARGQLAQAARQHGSDPLVEAASTLKAARTVAGRHVVFPVSPCLMQTLVYRKKVARTTNQVLSIHHIHTYRDACEPFSSLICYFIDFQSTFFSFFGRGRRVQESVPEIYFSILKIWYLLFLLSSESPGQDGWYI